MKIAIDTTPLLTGHKVRGSGFYLENLKNALIKYNPENDYYFFNHHEPVPSGVELTHYPYFDPFLLTLPLLSKNTVVTVHDLIPIVFTKYFPIGLKGALKWQIQKRALQNSKTIITDSECSKKDIIKYTGIKENMIHVVYLAAGEQFIKINNNQYLANVQSKYNLPDKFVLYVGDVTWNKNLPRLISAVNKAELPLVMVGKALKQEVIDKDNPWNKDLIKVLDEIKESKNIVRLGFIPSEDLVAIYSLATVFVMPSLYEGFGLPILEAMKCGCPVVTSKNGSLPEVAGEAAYYIDAENINSIADSLQRLFTDRSLQEKLARKGLEQAEKYSWSKTAQQTVEIYKRVISS